MIYRKMAQATYKFIFRCFFKTESLEYEWFAERLDEDLFVDENTDPIDLMEDFLNWRDERGFGHD